MGGYDIKKSAKSGLDSIKHDIVLEEANEDEDDEDDDVYGAIAARKRRGDQTKPLDDYVMKPAEEEKSKDLESHEKINHRFNTGNAFSVEEL